MTPHEGPSERLPDPAPGCEPSRPASRDRSHHPGLAPRMGVPIYSFLVARGCRRVERLEDSPSGLWRTLGKRVGCKPSGVRIPHPPPQFPLRRRLAGNLQPAPPGRPGSDPSEACEHRIGERMARVAHSIMTYFQRNPGIKRKSKSTHHHPESPMCIDPLGAHGSRRPIAAPHRKPRNIREIWRLLRIVALSHVQLRVAPPSNRAGRW